MGRRLALLLLWALSGGMATTLHAQYNEILNDRIASLQVVAGNDWLSLPVITMGNLSPITISFDDLTHEYHRYVYRIEHCEADWSTSEDLFVSDFVDGFNDGQPLNDLEESLNTNVLYTHYRLQIPNEHCRIKLSGNYRVTIYDENNDDEEVLRVYFMVVEPRMGISMNITTNTDIDINNAHQQVEMKLAYGSLNVTDIERQLKIYVLQNSRWDCAVVNPKPQFVMNDGLQWSHNRDLIFWGGNEYRKFEMLDVTHTTMGLESINWDGESYHAYVWPDEPRPSYIYDEDANGAFLIRNTDYEDDVDRTSEYMLVHFRMISPEYPGRVYVNGMWTHDWFLPQYEMQYNHEEKCYDAVIPLKQGYYSYQYLLLTDDGAIRPVPSEGTFYQTENQYEAFVYYRGFGERTDRLVGYGKVTYK
ncbi:MAG: DUF5103 domain-containing protein [Prevotella sp.]|nr:DUF5103 domain-containing protein [Prevotella sp.]